MWIFLNDRFVSEAEAKISVFDYGFLYGDGLFETLRSYNGKIFALAQHLKRLSNAADRLQLSIPSFDFLEQRLDETLERNQLKDAMLRLTVTRGENHFALRPDLCTKPTVVITARHFSGHPLKLYEKGVSAAITSVRRTSPVGAGPSVKSLSFLNNILARLETYGEEIFERILLTAHGYLSEGSVSNLFWVDRGILKTPSTDALILEGVTRKIIIDLAKKEGITVEEGLYRPKAIFKAEEAFLSSTGIELMPLTTLDGKKIGTGKPGPVTQKLHQKLKEHILAGQSMEG